MTFVKVLYYSFVKGIGRTAGVITIFGSLGLLYVSFTNLYNYRQLYTENKKKQTTSSVEHSVVEQVIKEEKNENEEEYLTYESDVEEIKTNKNYENNELFRKLFDKIK
jgi:hypothetical protein